MHPGRSPSQRPFLEVAAVLTVVIAPALGFLVGFEVLDDLARLPEDTVSPLAAALGAAVWVHLVYGLIAAVFLVLGLAAAYQALLEPEEVGPRGRRRRGAGDGAPGQADGWAHPSVSTPGDPRLAGAVRALRAVKEELDRPGPAHPADVSEALDRALDRVMRELTPPPSPFTGGGADGSEPASPAPAPFPSPFSV